MMLKGRTFPELIAGTAKPSCTAVLAHPEAEVVKLELARGDDHRTIGLFGAGASPVRNRGKQSTVSDRKSQSAQAAAHSIALRRDGVVAQCRLFVGRLGPGPESRVEKSSLIYAAIMGGQIGPDADLAAHDPGVQAISGLRTATGESGGKSRKELKSWENPAIGLHAVRINLATRGRRDATGEAATIDLAMVGAGVSLLPTSHPRSAPVFCCAGAAVQAVLAEPGHRTWQMVCALIGGAMAFDPALAADAGWTAQRAAGECRHPGLDRVFPVARRGATARRSASRMACRGTEAAMHLRGGHGFTRVIPLQSPARDARIFRICEGSPEIRRGIIAGHIL